MVLVLLRSFRSLPWGLQPLQRAEVGQALQDPITSGKGEPETQVGAASGPPLLSLLSFLSPVALSLPCVSVA